MIPHPLTEEDDAKGIPQMAYIGCIVTQSPRAELAQEVCHQLVAAAKYIDKQRIGSMDDCGFSPFSIDTKPNHGSPDYARDIAFQKITNRVTGTKMAAESLAFIENCYAQFRFDMWPGQSIQATRDFAVRFRLVLSGVLQ